MSDEGRITYRYIRAPQYRKIPTSGVWGGVTPDGNIIANFFVDSPEMPTSITHELRSGGVLGEEVARDYDETEGATIERSLEVGVVVSPEKARAIGQWLLAKAEEMEAGVDVDEGDED